jgi:acetylornithine deacetylase/succinyl-diaminopimelate desuccinylase-like protein
MRDSEGSKLRVNRRAQELLNTFLDSAGLETALLDADPAPPNLVARLRGHQPKAVLGLRATSL